MRKSVLERLYDSEINFSISCFWDGGYDVKLGDPMNGFKYEDNHRKYEDALGALEENAVRLFPDSEFTKEVMRHEDSQSSLIPASIPAPVVDRECPDCGGNGYFLTSACCQKPHRSGECCGNAEQEQTGCETCGGTGRLALLPAGTGDAEAGWQDISTAPDSSENVEVVVFGGRFDKPTVFRSDGGFWRYEKTRGLKYIPTHWHPYRLPAPPADREGK